MIRLLRSETLRALSRRVVAMLLVAGVILIVVAMVIAAANSHKPSPDEVARAQASSQQQFARCMQGKFSGSQGQVPPGFGSLQEFCTAVSEPEPAALIVEGMQAAIRARLTSSRTTAVATPRPWRAGVTA